MFLENIKEAITSIFSNKMRSVLTMLGIIIGISAVITITTIGNSIQTTLTSTLNSLGGNTVQAYVDARYPEDDADWDTWEYPEMKTSDFVTQEMIDQSIDHILCNIITVCHLRLFPGSPVLIIFRITCFHIRLYHISAKGIHGCRQCTLYGTTDRCDNDH